MTANAFLTITAKAYALAFAIVAPMFAWMGLPWEPACWLIVCGGGFLTGFACLSDRAA